MTQVAEDLGDAVRILKIDTDENPELSSQLQVGNPGGLRAGLGSSATQPSMPSCEFLSGAAHLERNWR